MAEEDCMQRFEERRLVAAQEFVRQQQRKPTSHGTGNGPRPRTGLFLPEPGTAASSRPHKQLPLLYQPRLVETLTEYQKSGALFVTKSQAKTTSALVEHFQQGEGLQAARLLDKTPDAWFDRWHLDRKLQGRHSAFLNSNPVVLLNPDPVPERNTQIERAARLASALMAFKTAVDEDEMPPDMKQKEPLTMHSYSNIFSSTRIPEEGKDSISFYRKSSHIAVSWKGRWYIFDAYDAKSERFLTTCEIEDQLIAITTTPPPYGGLSAEDLKAMMEEKPVDRVQSATPASGPSEPQLPTAASNSSLAYQDGDLSEHSRRNSKMSMRESTPHMALDKPVTTGTYLAIMEGHDPSPPVGALTWLGREKWAEQRNALRQIPATAATLDFIEGAIFHIVLDPETPSEPEDSIKAIMHGDGLGRWADKSLSLVVCANGVAGLTGEAVAYDHSHIHRLASKVWHMSNDDQSVAEERWERVQIAEKRSQLIELQAQEMKRRQEEAEEKKRQREKEAREAEAEAEAKKKASGKKAPPSKRKMSATPSNVGDDSVDMDVVMVKIAIPDEINPLPIPRLLEWDIPSSVRVAIKTATTSAAKMFPRCKFMDLRCNVGERKLRTSSVPIHVFASLALQLAMYKVHSNPSVIVEHIDMSHYQRGRHQAIPVGTKKSFQFCTAACGLSDRKHSVQELFRLLLGAAEEQSGMRDHANKSLGWYSHLIAVQQASKFLQIQKNACSEISQWWAQENDAERAREQARVRARELRELLEKEQEEEKVRAQEDAASAKKNAKNPKAGDKDKKDSKATTPPVRTRPSTKENDATLSEEALDALEKASQPLPRPLRQLSPAVRTVPEEAQNRVFTDHTFNTLIHPMLELRNNGPSPGIACMVHTPSPVKRAFAMTFIVEPLQSRFVFTSFGSTDFEMEEMATYLKDSFEGMYYDYYLKGKTSRTAVLVGGGLADSPRATLELSMKTGTRPFTSPMVAMRPYTTEGLDMRPGSGKLTPIK